MSPEMRDKKCLFVTLTLSPGDHLYKEEQPSGFNIKRMKDISTLRCEIKKMRTHLDLFYVLNEVKKHYAETEGISFYPINRSNFEYYISSKTNRNQYYKEFDIRKKYNDGKRHIIAPFMGLKDIQKAISLMLQLIYTPYNNVNGFVQGRCIMQNAYPHVFQNYIFNIDIKDFFPSIHQARVWKKLQLPPLNFPVAIANAIANVCCYELINDDDTKIGVLPQGAPSSPILSNIVCERLDWKLRKLARENNLIYTRYADDMTFSGMYNAFSPKSEFIIKLYATIHEENFVVNESKTSLMKRGAHQEVTGLVISDKVNVPRSYIREIRSLLYIWERFGEKTASYRFALHNSNRKDKTLSEIGTLENVLLGKIEYVKMVKGANDSTYLALKGRLDKLLGAELSKKEKRRESREKKLRKVVPHNLEETQKFFHLFDYPEGFKYLTHDFPEGEEWSVDQLKEQCIGILKNYSNYSQIPTSLWALVNVFVIGKYYKKTDWIDYEGRDQRITYSDFVGGEGHPILGDHKEVIERFKNTIRVRMRCLYNLCVSWNDPKYGLNITMDKNELNKADFYTNVFILKKSVQRIFQMFASRNDKKDVNIHYHKEDIKNRRCHILTITQQDSYSEKGVDELRPKLHGGGGDFATLKHDLSGYCNWSVLSVWNEKPAKWNILRESDVDEIEEVTDKPVGFTHILTFYGNKLEEDIHH